ncbi:hypothetical protein SAMN05661093_11260 [Kibdelosporangium aridum]|uniref:Tetratricopeptide repeat protein n=1 Tax=Kibdelosporangium aridum TaxID=2030 RepID=A0A1W2G0F1_KIBAR|nr:hypothetical protein SAMN05661093_11260 [Kibdelosporangium aridum]
MGLDAESPNLHTALNTAISTGAAEFALRLVNALTWYWCLRGRLAEARRSLTAALTLLPRANDDTTADQRARVRIGHAAITLLQGRFGRLDQPPESCT